MLLCQSLFRLGGVLLADLSCLSLRTAKCRCFEQSPRGFIDLIRMILHKLHEVSLDCVSLRLRERGLHATLQRHPPNTLRCASEKRHGRALNELLLRGHALTSSFVCVSGTKQ